MDGEGTDNGIENVGYFEEYTSNDIQWADGIDEHDLTATEDKDKSVHERHDDHVYAVDIECVSQGEADDCASGSHHVICNTQELDQEFKNASAISNYDDATYGSESTNGATFYNIQLVDSVRHVTRRSVSKSDTPSEMESEQHTGLAMCKTTEETKTNGTSQDVPITSRKTSWISRFCTDPVFRTNVCESIAVQLHYASMGWIYAMMGPSLPDLQIISGMGLQEASWLFTGFAIGYMIGCAASGLLLIKISDRVLVVLAGITAAVSSEILPLIPNGYVMVAMRTVGGGAMGVQDTSLTARLFKIWGSDAGPWIQMLHCMFSVGGIMSPLVIKLFLAQTLVSNATISSTNGTVFDVSQTEFENSGVNLTNLPDTRTISTVDGIHSTVDIFLTTESSIGPTIAKSNIHYAYLISALLSIITAVPFIIYYLKDRQRSKNGKLSEMVSAGDKEANADVLPNKWKYTMLILMCLISFIATGYLDAFPNYLTSFGILQLDATKEDGSFATSIYFAMYAVGNLVGVIILRYMSSGKYITISHAGISVALALFYISIHIPLTKPVQWTFVAMNGIAMSAIVPTTFTWTQDNVTSISGRIASAYLVSGSLGIMVTPMFLGYLMENVTPMWFMYTMFVYEGVCIVLFVAVTVISMYSGRHKISTRRTSMAITVK